MIFPRREEASNKDLILTIIEIQGFLSRYGKSHTNWHETLNEVIARLEQEPTTKNEAKYCDRNICLRNEYNNVGCDDCEVTKSQEQQTDIRDKRVKDELKQIKSELEPKTEWVPVSERLPKDKEHVLVTYNHFISGNTIGIGSMIVFRNKPHWNVWGQNQGTYDVLAWQPLPKPYSEDKE